MLESARLMMNLVVQSSKELFPWQNLTFVWPSEPWCFLVSVGHPVFLEELLTALSSKFILISRCAMSGHEVPISLCSLLSLDRSWFSKLMCHWHRLLTRFIVKDCRQILNGWVTVDMKLCKMPFFPCLVSSNIVSAYILHTCWRCVTRGSQFQSTFVLPSYCNKVTRYFYGGNLFSSMPDCLPSKEKSLDSSLLFVISFVVSPTVNLIIQLQLTS